MFKIVIGFVFVVGVIFGGKYLVEIEGSCFEFEDDYGSEFDFMMIFFIFSYSYEFFIFGNLSGVMGFLVGLVMLEVEFMDYDYVGFFFIWLYCVMVDDEVFVVGFYVGVVY